VSTTPPRAAKKISDTARAAAPVEPVVRNAHASNVAVKPTASKPVAPKTPPEPVDVSLIALAKIGRPYGLAGAMHVYPFSDDAVTLKRAKSVTIRARTYPVKNIRVHGDALVMMIDGIDSPESAQTLTNAEILVARDALPPLPKGEYYWIDLVGLRCTNGDRVFGDIVEVFGAGAHPILRVRPTVTDEKLADKTPDELIPFVDAIIRSVDLEARCVDVDWEGLE
jgi:16S rRNA processing protein RimM